MRYTSSTKYRYAVARECERGTLRSQSPDEVREQPHSRPGDVIIAFISTTQMISLSPLLINFLSRNFFSSSFFLIIFYILLCVYILLYNEYYMLIELRLGACGMVINIYHLVILLSLLNRLLG